jgi:hypothetical protein
MAISYICVDVLEVCQPVLTILGVLDIIFSNQLIASGGEENAIHEIGDSSRIILLVSLVP